MKSVTSKQIMDECGIRNVKTLTRWHQAGLIPLPEVGRHPGGGRGKIAKWPAWVLEHCKTIASLTESGRRLDEIHERFGTDWKAIAARYRPYRFADDAKQNRKATIKHIKGQLESLATGLAAVSAKHIGTCLDEANKLEGTGLRPVMLVTSEAVRVVTEEEARFTCEVGGSLVATLRLVSDIT